MSLLCVPYTVPMYLQRSSQEAVGEVVLLRLLLTNSLLLFLLLGSQGLVKWNSICFLACKKGPCHPSITHSISMYIIYYWPGIERNSKR